MQERRLRRNPLPRRRRTRPKITLAKLQAIATIVQPLVISAAVVVGGIWTLYTFQAQLHVENSEALLEKLKRELASEPRLEIGIDTVQLDIPDSTVRHVLGTINIKNVGSANTLLNLPAEPVQIYRVTVGAGRELWTHVRAVDLKAGPAARTGGLMCHVNATLKVQFIARVNAAGLYVVSFAAQRSEAEAQAARKLRPDVVGTDRVEWSAAHYFTLR